MKKVFLILSSFVVMMMCSCNRVEIIADTEEGEFLGKIIADSIKLKFETMSKSEKALLGNPKLEKLIITDIKEVDTVCPYTIDNFYKYGLMGFRGITEYKYTYGNKERWHYLIGSGDLMDEKDIDDAISGFKKFETLCDKMKKSKATYSIKYRPVFNTDSKPINELLNLLSPEQTFIYEKPHNVVIDTTGYSDYEYYKRKLYK